MYKVGMTRQTIGVILLAATVLASRSIHGQSTDTENVKIVTTGEVRKIDDKEKTFQFKFKLDQPTAYRGQQPAGRRGGVYGRRRGGYPGGNRAPVPAAVDDTKEVKVFTSTGTTFKDTKGDLQFSDLKKGDRITVTAIHRGRGDDIEALAVKRN
jgi:hypothetical protein